MKVRIVVRMLMGNTPVYNFGSYRVSEINTPSSYNYTIKFLELTGYDAYLPIPTSNSCGHLLSNIISVKNSKEFY